MRSLTSGQASALGAVGHRIQVRDADFNVAGATFYYQGMYSIEGEAEGLREDNIGSRRFTVSWNGAKWTASVPTSGNTMAAGTVLARWTGSAVTSGANLPDDGRVYVNFVRVGPTVELGWDSQSQIERAGVWIDTARRGFLCFVIGGP